MFGALGDVFGADDDDSNLSHDLFTSRAPSVVRFSAIHWNDAVCIIVTYLCVIADCGEA